MYECAWARARRILFLKRIKKAQTARSTAVLMTSFNMFSVRLFALVMMPTTVRWRVRTWQLIHNYVNTVLQIYIRDISRDLFPVQRNSAVGCIIMQTEDVGFNAGGSGLVICRRGAHSHPDNTPTELNINSACAIVVNVTSWFLLKCPVVILNLSILNGV